MCDGCNHNSDLEEKLRDFSKKYSDSLNNQQTSIYSTKKEYIKPIIYKNEPLTNITF